MRYLFSVYSDSARIALQSILAHKLRAFLTLIGIIIGVALLVVLGADIKDKFYPDIDPVGKEFKVAGLPMRVVGVEERRGPIFGELIDKHVYIPLTTFQRIYGRNLDLQIHGKGKQRSTFLATIEDA